MNDWEIVYVSNPEIWDKADQVRLMATKDVDTHPVDIENVIDIVYGIDLVPEPGLMQLIDVEGFLSYDGMAIHVDEDRFKSEKFSNRFRFTLAHELGHYELHRQIYRKIKFRTVDEYIKMQRNMPLYIRQSYERQADEFAGRLLVPIEPLLQAIVDNIGEVKEMMKINKDVSNREISDRIEGDIAPRFEVSADVIGIRIWKEKIDLKLFAAEN